VGSVARKCFFDGPSGDNETPVQGGIFYTCNPRPLGHATRDAVQSKQSVLTGVFVLFCGGSPSAVFGGVITAVVGTVQAVVRGGAAPHVSKKNGVITPRRVHRDPPSAVTSVRRVFRVSGSLDHLSPANVLRRTGIAVGGAARFNPLYHQAAAGLGAPAREVVAHNGGASAAFAFTKPQRLAAFRAPNGAQGGQAPELSIRDIFSVWVKCYKLAFSHVVTSINDVIRWRGGPTSRLPIVAQAG